MSCFKIGAGKIEHHRGEQNCGGKREEAWSTPYYRNTYRSSLVLLELWHNRIIPKQSCEKFTILHAVVFAHRYQDK